MVAEHNVPRDQRQGPAQLITYSALNWGVRSSFISQLLRPYSRLGKRAFPVATVGFQPQKDDRGNYRPTFNIVDWRPRSDFAQILGEEPAMPQIERPDLSVKRLEEARRRIGEMVEEANAPIVHGKAEISTGRNRDAGDDSRVQAPPPDRYNGPDGPTT